MLNAVCWMYVVIRICFRTKNPIFLFADFGIMHSANPNFLQGAEKQNVSGFVFCKCFFKHLAYI